VNATNGRRFNEGREDISPPVGNIAVQNQWQDLQYVTGYYDMANAYSPPYRHHDQIIQDVPIQDHVAPPVPVCADLTSMHAFI
jgi:hypothetical protein